MKPILVLLLSVTTLLAQTPAPETFTHQVTYAGQTISIDFTKFSCRGPLFDVVLQTTGQTNFVDHTHDATVRTYLGSVLGHPGAIAAGMIRADGEILARVTFANATEWLDFDGTVTTRGSAVTNPTATTLSVPVGGAGNTLYAADVLIDLPYPQVQSSGGTADQAVEMAEFSMMCINTSYLRDAALLNRIGLVILRMASAQDPYQGQTTTGEMLGEVLSENASFINNSSSPRGNHDLGLTASTQVGGGLAYVGVVATGSGFSSNGSDSNGDFSVVGRHELGHNWGSNHFEGGGTPEGSTIMSGNSLGKFSSGELTRILSHRNSRLSFLESLPSNSHALPPRASNDVLIAEVGSSPATVFPLANDSDTNGGTLTLLSFDATSRQGMPVSQVGNELTIPVSQDFSLSTDRVSYTIQDNTNKTSEAHIFLKSYLDGETLGHWTFDQETSVAVDSSSYVNDAQLQSNAFIQDQVLHLDGDGDRASALLNRPVQSNTITYVARVYRNGTQNSFAGLIFQRDNDHLGFNLGSSNELRYHWDNSSHWNYNSGLVIPDHTWCFVALVIEPTQATFYLDDGTNGLQSVSRSSTHVIKSHTAYSVGQDPNFNSRAIKGQMNDVRIINRALTLNEVNALSQGGLGVCNPSPDNGSKVTRDSIRLKWTPSQISQSQRLFLHSNYTTLRDAVIGSSADKGLVSANQYDLIALDPGHYYWRVDTIESNGLSVAGPIWSFEVRADGLIAHYPLDQIQTGNPATTPCLCGSDHDGAVLGTPAIKEGVIDQAFEMNTSTATNSRLTLPASTFDDVSDEITISFWAKGHGPSFPRANFIFEGLDAAGNRLLGAHLPWTDSNVYWDAGNSSGHDRIYETAPTTLTVDHWTHWAFVKDASTGEMTIFTNGAVFQSGSGKTLSFDTAMANFSIGGANNTSNKWAGCLDDFRIYSTALGSESIRGLYQAGIPYYQWAANYYSPLELLDGEISAPEGNNLLAYAMQSDPSDPSPAGLMAVDQQIFSFTRLKEGSGEAPYFVDDLAYYVEASSDLTPGSWSSDPTLWEEASPRVDGANDTESFFIRPTDSDLERLFFRLRLEHRPH